MKTGTYVSELPGQLNRLHIYTDSLLLYGTEERYIYRKVPNGTTDDSHLSEVNEWERAPTAEKDGKSEDKVEVETTRRQRHRQRIDERAEERTKEQNEQIFIIINIILSVPHAIDFPPFTQVGASDQTCSIRCCV